MSESDKKSLKKDRKIWLMLLGAAAGILLLLFGSLGGADKGEKETPTVTPPDPAVYAQELEEQVA